tara:strand:- start:42 stop:338 length:297 start_codon:yes stop_codon:yes gene_type:complete
MINICRQSRTTWHHNPISGHHWSVTKQLKGYEVYGGIWTKFKCNTLKGAEEERDFRVEYDLKHPFVMPRSKREIASCERLGIEVTKPYKEMETGKIIT